MSFRRIFLALGVVAMTLPTVAARADEPAKTPEGDSSRPHRILFVTQSKGFRHGAVTRKDGRPAPAEQAMEKLGVTTGLFRVDATQDVEKDFTKEKLDQYDIVMFYTTGELPIPVDVREYFLNDWLKQPGHGFLGVHSAADTYHKYPPYYEMIGGTFDGHPWGSGSTVTVKVHDTAHPAAKPWGESVTLKDEIYQFKNFKPENVRVLMSLDMAETDKKKPYHVPVLWVKEWGEGKVMHMSMGHREDLWTNEAYLASLTGGIRWLLDEAEGDATPNPDLSAAQDKAAQQAVETAK